MITIAAVIRRELLVFSRYPSWILSMLIWPLLFPLVYLLGSRALTGPGGEGLPAFVRATGTEVRPIAGNGGQPGHAVGGHLVRGVFMVFAGICFPLSVLPGWMRTAAAYLPLTHTIEGARAALLSGAGIADLRPSLAFLFWSGMVLFTLGYVSFEAVDRIVRRQGSVGHH